MTDKELLEKAAKAAGVLLEGVEQDGRGVTIRGTYWQPLHDDGDALRLAVKLDMSIKQDDPNAAIAGWSNLQRINITSSKQGPWYWKEWLRDNENNRAAATRRAITRAAAQMADEVV